MEWGKHNVIFFDTLTGTIEPKFEREDVSDKCQLRDTL